MQQNVDEIKKIIREIQSNRLDTTQVPDTDPSFDSLLKCDVARVAHILNLIPRQPNLKICEIGMGYGYIAIPLRKLIPTCSLYAVEKPTREYMGSSTYNNFMKDYNIDLKEADVTTQRLPFNDESFDVIIFSEIMEHISPVAVTWVFSEVRRCLRDGGMAIITTPNILRLRNRIRFLLGKNILASPATIVGGTYEHIREYSHSEVRELLLASGFQKAITSPSGIRYPILLTRVDRLISRTGAMLARYSITFEDFVVAQAFRK
jgi:2-polyprenyl-3-methyl-5-hydroxy-6-metoxy-1,4-benzoquinol methylase